MALAAPESSNQRAARSWRMPATTGIPVNEHVDIVEEREEGESKEDLCRSSGRQALVEEKYGTGGGLINWGPDTSRTLLPCTA